MSPRPTDKAPAHYMEDPNAPVTKGDFDDLKRQFTELRVALIGTIGEPNLGFIHANNAHHQGIARIETTVRVVGKCLVFIGLPLLALFIGSAYAVGKYVVTEYAVHAVAPSYSQSTPAVAPVAHNP